MTPQETDVLLASAQAAFPNSNVTTETASVWQHFLADTPADAAAAALANHIRESRWFPAISDILAGVKAQRVAQAELDAADREHAYQQIAPPSQPELVKKHMPNIRRILKSVDAPLEAPDILQAARSCYHAWREALPKDAADTRVQTAYPHHAAEIIAEYEAAMELA